jgi:subtilase family serine protease
MVSAVNAFGQSSNSTQVSVSITALPDVTITALSTTNLNPIYAGDKVVFRATVKNQGAAATPTGPGKGIGIGFSLDNGAFFCYRGADENFSLAPGASATLSANGPAGGFTWTATPGAHSLLATVDDVNRFPESDESNNSFSTNITVLVHPPRFSGITNASDGTLTLTFSVFAGQTYRVEFKNNWEDADWMPLGDDIVASSNTISVPDNTIGNAHRFFRVLQLD